MRLKTLTWREHFDTLHHGSRPGNGTGAQVARDCFAIQLTRHQTTRKESAHLRREHDAIRAPVEIERLNSQSVARKYQLPFGAIPNGEREHAAETGQDIQAPAHVATQNHFGIGS